MWWRLVAMTSACLISLAITIPAGAKQEVEAPAPSVVVILVEGLNSASAEAGAVFMHLWPAVQALRPDAMRIDFSYRGGTYDATGVWQAAPYGPCDTHQSVFFSTAELGATVRATRERYPDARLAVVGHSLGGIVAVTWLAEATPQQVLVGDVPDAVVTVDSPLRGISPEHAKMGWISGVEAHCPALQALPELVALYRGQGAEPLRVGIDVAVAQGSRVVMVADNEDIAFSCCRGDQVVAPDIEWAQVIDSSLGEVLAYPSIEPDLPGLDLNQPVSHHAALFNAAIVEQLAAAVVGD